MEENEDNEKELKSNLENLMYQKLTVPEQEIVIEYVSFLKSQIKDLKMNKRDKESYKKQLKEEYNEKNKYKENLEYLKKKYGYVLEKQAETEIELDIAKTKILKLGKSR